MEWLPGSSRVERLIGTGGACRRDRARLGLEERRRSSAMSLAVVYRSDARFESAFRQMRSSSLGIVSSIWRGGRASAGVILLEDLADVNRLGTVGAGQQLVEDHAQAEDVGSTIDPVPFAPGLLGAHVGGCSGDPPPLPKSSSLRASPKSATTWLARGIDQDVGGLDVPVDQAPGVGVVQGFGDRRHQFRRLPERQGEPVLDPLARSLPSMNFDTTKQRPSSVRPTS